VLVELGWVRRSVAIERAVVEVERVWTSGRDSVASAVVLSSMQCEVLQPVEPLVLP
jgi:hypothetical protein